VEGSICYCGNSNAAGLETVSYVRVVEHILFSSLH
jgi:hypothetical protein